MKLSKANIVSAIFITTSFGFGFLLSRVTQPATQSVREIRDPGGYQFINPLLECDTPFNPDNNLDPLKDKIENLIHQRESEGKITFAAVYYRDLNNGPWFGVNSQEYFSPASLIKVPLLMAYYKEAENNPELLKTEIQYDPGKDHSQIDQNYKPQVTLTPGQKYTIDELLKRSIVYSDNEAYEILYNHINPLKVMAVYNDLGIDISKAATDPAGNIITVRSYASFFRILFNSSYLNKAMSEKALELLSHTDFKEGLPSGLPTNVTVSHKFGERYYSESGERQLHDCGIVYASQKPYLLCVMTRGHAFPQLTSTIKEISQEVYEGVSSK